MADYDPDYDKGYGIGSTAPQRGDVMVFRYPPKPSLAYIKRVVGVPGDEVLYTPPVTPWERVPPEVGSLTARGALTTAGFVTGVKS